MDDDLFKIFVSIVQDGSNDPKVPSTLFVLKNGVLVLGQVSAGDPDYFVSDPLTRVLSTADISDEVLGFDVPGHQLVVGIGGFCKR